MAEEFKRPGWYPSPDSTLGERWWNGASWSDSRRGAPAAPTSAAAVYSAGSPAPVRPDPYAVPPTGAPPRPVIAAAKDRLALIGLVLGAIGVFGFSALSPAAIVVSAIAIARARRLRTSPVLAAIGLALGIIGTVTLIVAVVAFIATFTAEFTSS